MSIRHLSLTVLGLVALISTAAPAHAGDPAVDGVWSFLAPEAAAPSARREYAAIFDAQNDRYLIFGSECDMQVVRGRIEADGPRVVRRVVEPSTLGRVVSNKPCLRVLAMSLTLGNKAARVMAREAAPEVARTPDELRKLEQYVNTMRGTTLGAAPGTKRGGERGAVVPSVRPPRTSRLIVG